MKTERQVESAWSLVLQDQLVCARGLTSLASFSAKTVFKLRFFLIATAGVEVPEVEGFFFSESETSQSSYPSQ
jgi:hypothetical protein